MAGENTELSIIVRLKDFATAEFKKLGSTINRLPSTAVGAFGKITGSVFNLRNAIIGLGTAFATNKALGFAKDLTQQAAGLEGVTLGFENLTKNIGGADRVLASLRKGTRETVDDLKLFETANKAILLDVARSPEEFEKLTTTARRLGRAVGRDTLDAFNDLATGIGRQSKLILDNLGLLVSIEDANESYAKSLGKTVDQLTEAEKRQAFLNATLEAADERIAGLGEDVLTLGDEYGRLNSEIKNIVNDTLRELTPALTDLTKRIADSIKENKPAILEFFAVIIEKAGELATSVGETLDAIRSAVNFTQRTINEFKLGQAQDRLADYEGEIRKVNDELAALAETGEDIFTSKRGQELFSTRRGFQQFVDSAKKDIAELSGDYDKLVKAQTKASEQSFASGKTEAELKKAAAAVRGYADEIKRGGEAANPFAAIEDALKNVVTLTEDAARAEEKARQDYIDGAEARAEAVAAAFAESFEFFDKENEQAEKSAKLREDIREDLEAEALLRADLIVQVEAQAAAQAKLEAAEKKRLEDQIDDLDRERNGLRGLSEGFQQLEADGQAWGEAAKLAVEEVSFSLANNLSDGILAVADGTKSAKDAFRDFARGALADIQRIIIQTLILKAVQSSLGGVGGALFAQGGVLPGRPEPVRGLARGDIIQPPGGTFKIAEAGRPEAVLPLIRSSRGDLGVQMVGPASTATAVNVTVNYNGLTIGEKQLFQRNQEQIQQAVAKAVRQSAQYREQIRTAA